MQDLFMSNAMYNIDNMHNIYEMQYVTIQKNEVFNKYEQIRANCEFVHIYKTNQNSLI